MSEHENQLEQEFNPEPESNEQESLFKSGQKVTVQRTSGEIEHDWKVLGYPKPDKVTVYKETGDGGIIEKTILESKLKSWQSEGLSPETSENKA